MKITLLINIALVSFIAGVLATAFLTIKSPLVCGITQNGIIQGILNHGN